MSVPEIRLITEPTVIVLFDMQPDIVGLNQLLNWVQDYRPECVPDELPNDARDRAMALFPHGGYEELADKTGPKIDRTLTGNELLVELAGRECYHSYGLKAGRKENAEYIHRMLFPEDPTMLPHASVAYHAKMTFFIAGVSRRVSHELIRHYVGADRTEEGSPSQESTRYTFHPGHFAVPPYVLERAVQTVPWPESDALISFQRAMESAYVNYLSFIEREESAWEKTHGKKPTAIDRKRIYECAAGLLPMQACTSFVWTTNPLALGKHPGAWRIHRRLPPRLPVPPADEHLAWRRPVRTVLGRLVQPPGDRERVSLPARVPAGGQLLLAPARVRGVSCGVDRLMPASWAGPAHGASSGCRTGRAPRS